MISAPKPTVSVCIASYNHARFLPATLESVLSQSFRDFEVVVVDDGSKDDSLEVLKNYQIKDPRIKLFTHSGNINKGISKTFNLAIAQAQGKYLAWIGSDDIWNADLLEQLIFCLQSDDSVGLVYGISNLIDEQGNELDGEIGFDITAVSKSTYNLLQENNAIPHLTTLFKKECVDKIGTFDEALVFSDWELWVRISSHHQMGFVNKPLAKYRIHGKNTSAGIPKVVELKHRLAVYEALSMKSRQIGGRLASPEVKELLDKKINQSVLDLFYLTAQKGEMALAYHYLGKMMLTNPVELLRPARSASILKHALKGALK